MKIRVKCVIVLVLIFLWRLDMFAQISENVAIHGFGGWAYGKTDNDNRYLTGNHDGSYDYINLSLNITAKPYENLCMHVQPSFNEDLDGSDVELDYAFAEWSFSDAFNLRVGKVKAPSMLYTEVYDVGTIRPFFFLPQAIYQELAAEAYKGAGVTGTVFFESGWDVVYDLYGGKLTLQSVPFLDLETFRFDSATPVVNDMVGGRLFMHTPLDGFNFGLSSYTGDVDLKIGRLDLSDRYTGVAVSAEYITGPWWIRGEYLTQQQSPKVTINTIYTEVAYQFMENWQAAIRYEIADFGIPDLDALYPESYLEHREIVLGLNYWLNPNLVFKFSCHMVEGNRFAVPETIEDYLAAMQHEFQETTHLFVLGVQFSF